MTADAIDNDARAIVWLNVWSKAAACNWAMVSQMSEEPILVAADARSDATVAGRLLFFLGFAAFREFAILRQAPDLGYALSPLDVRHWELIGLKDGGYEIHDFQTGYLPRPADAAARDFLAPFLHECRGFLMRLEEDAELPARYSADGKIFSRTEGLDGKWRDAPLAPPADAPRTNAERVALDPAACARAGALPFREGTAWEVDFFSVPGCCTAEPHPRIMYLMAAVDAATGARVLWDRMSVANGAADGLVPLWESLAGRLLQAIIKNGGIPGAVHVRSGRVTRLLRPLGLQIPFRLVHHAKLPALDAAMQRAAKERKF